MRSEQEVRDMLARFDAAHEADELDDEGEAVWETLKWFVYGYLSEGTVTDYLPI